MNKVHGAATPHVIGTSSSSTASAGPPPPRPEPRPQRGRDELHQLASFFDSDRRITELYRVLPSFFFTGLQKEPMNRIRPPEADMVGGWGVAQLSISFAYVHAWPIAKSLPSFYRVLRVFFSVDHVFTELYRVYVLDHQTGVYRILFYLFCFFTDFFFIYFFFLGLSRPLGSDRTNGHLGRHVTSPIAPPPPPAKGQQ